MTGKNDKIKCTDNYKIQYYNCYMYVQRKLAFILKNAVKQFPTVLVTGPRQAGKTTCPLLASNLCGLGVVGYRPGRGCMMILQPLKLMFQKCWTFRQK